MLVSKKKQINLVTIGNYETTNWNELQVSFMYVQFSVNIP